MPTAPIVPYDESVTHQLGVLPRAVNRTPGRTRLYLLAGAIVLVIVATAAMQVRLNAWNQPFYDAIERRDLPEFVQPALGLLRDRRHPARAQRGADRRSTS